MKLALKSMLISNLMIGLVTALWSVGAFALGRPPIVKIGQEVPPVVSYDMVDGSPFTARASNVWPRNFGRMA